MRYHLVWYQNLISGESSRHVRQLWGFALSQGRTSVETPQTCIAKICCREFHATGISCARDYYEILGLNKGATQMEIKKAYYALAKVHHPDMNKGDTDSEKKFQEIQKAYEVLKDDEKRAIYDQVGPDGYEQAGPNGGGGSGFDDGGFGFPFSDLNEMWSEKSQERQKKAADRHRRDLKLKENDWVLLRFEKARL
ncbi:hypothetical protein L7F22_016280 [Adiantum nelumboides]|nr:hypothetical protein [Adiantum nelumboides]